jgi:metalloendopeptidase OMA1, mitochondrial
MRPRKIHLLPIVLAAGYFLFRMLTAETYVNPETGEKHRVAFSPQQEASLGLQSYQQVLSESQTINSGPQAEMVRRVAQRICSVVDANSRQFDWRVSLVQSDEENAFCLPGGKMVVYTGILPVTQNEAALAAVLGHEVAHATARHGAQRVFQQQGMQILLTGVQASLSNMDYQQQRTLLGLLGAGAKFGVALPFSRDHELEADRVGLTYMARAGYNPREAVAFWQRMAASGGRKPPELMSTHPADATRIRQLERLLPDAEKEYRKAVGGAQ